MWGSRLEVPAQPPAEAPAAVAAAAPPATNDLVDGQAPAQCEATSSRAPTRLERRASVTRAPIFEAVLPAGSIDRDPPATELHVTMQDLPAAIGPSLAAPVEMGGDHGRDDDGLDRDVESVRMLAAPNNDLQHALLKTADSADSGIDDALHQAAQAARESLREFASSHPPERHDRLAAFSLALVLMLRWPLALVLKCPCCRRQRKGFFRSLVRLGGVEKINILLTVSGFDCEGATRAEFERQGEQVVASATAGCQNISVVATLFIGLSHLNSIGRPSPWGPSATSLTALGTGWCDGLMYAAMAFNVVIELGALSLLLYCNLSRVLLVYVLPTLGSRLIFITDSNLPGNLAVAISWLGASVSMLVAVGGLLHSPKWGLIALGAGPACILFIMFFLSKYYFQGTLILHHTAHKLLHEAEYGPRSPGPPGVKRQLTRGGASGGLSLRMLYQPHVHESTIQQTDWRPHIPRVFSTIIGSEPRHNGSATKSRGKRRELGSPSVV